MWVTINITSFISNRLLELNALNQLAINSSSFFTETSGREEFARLALKRGTTQLYYSRGEIVIGLKKVGNALTMFVRMPESLYSAARGLLVQGCPRDEISRQGMY